MKRFLPAIPYPHFMAFATLDVWARLVWGTVRHGRGIGPRFWLRLAGALFTSAIGTVITLPERVALWPVMARAYRRSGNPHAERGGTQGTRPKVVVVLGYFRSGTTHLHYILSCDPRFVTPRWHQALAPAGFVVSWMFLRWFLVPFLSSERPQDDVAYGPEWPCEDDFALCNGGLASSLPGRMVLPRDWDGERGWRRWHGLEGLTEQELERWRRAQWGFTWKLAALGRGRTVLLKTPSHTARVAELVRLYGAEKVKFVHIRREAGAVVRSNVAMHARLAQHFLQDTPGDEEIRARVVEEYERTERKFEEEAAALGPGMLSRVRFEELVGEPMTALRRVYAELGLGWSEEVAERFEGYLDSVRDYRTAEQRGDAGVRSHNAPSPRPPPTPGQGSFVAGLLAAVAAAGAWLAVAWITRDRMDWLVWPVGIAIGVVALRAAGRAGVGGAGGGGSVRLGLWTGALTLLVWLGIAFPATYLTCNDYWKRPGPTPWGDVWDSTRDGLLATNNLFWAGLGVMTACRFASRKHVRPPGM